MTSEATGSWHTLRPVVLAWAFLAALTTAPYVRAWLAPPAGTSFVGSFYYVDDTYNYLSYAEQAERGSFFFENKLAERPRARTLINVEWWLVGRLSAVLGGRPFLAYRLLALGAGFALLAGFDRWLRATGVPASHRLPALLLVGLGGGLGGPAWRAGLVPLSEAPDLTAGLFPFIELLANPHFVLGTALLVWSLFLFSRTDRGWRGRGLAGLLCTLLGLVRPYDLALLAGARTLAVVATLPPREWLAGALPLLWLVPTLAYSGWVFFGGGHFSSFARTYAPTPPVGFALALGATLILACASLRGPAPEPEAGTARLHLWGWIGVALAIVVLRPVGYPLQFLVGIGAPLLLLGCVALSRFRLALTLLVALGLSGTSAAALGLVFSNNPRWYVSPESLQVAWALRTACRPGDLALAPPDIGLYVLGLTACDAYVSHPVASRHLERTQALAWFLGQAAPGERGAFLDREKVRFLVLPAAAGPVPERVLGEGTPFRPIPGGMLRTLAVYGRAP